MSTVDVNCLLSEFEHYPGVNFYSFSGCGGTPHMTNLSALMYHNTSMNKLWHATILFQPNVSDPCQNII